MSVTRINITSDEMKKATKFVRLMTKSMPFDENMESFNWVKARKRNDLFYKLMPKAKGVSYYEIEIMGKKALLTQINGVEDDTHIVIYLHGGGFVTGNALVTKGYTSMLAKHLRTRVYSIDYSLAPEHKFPKGFDECCEAFEYLTKEFPNAAVTLVGESAGGNLCLALAHKYKSTHKITSVIANSPSVDFSETSDSSVNDDINNDFIVKKSCLEPLKRMYVGEGDVNSPFVSPLLGDFNGFPPTFITCDAQETLYGGAMELYEKCKAAGVYTKIVIASGAFHAFANTGDGSPETKRILKDTTKFIHRCLLMPRF